MTCGVHQVVDTTGAGDCYTAAFAVAQLQGKSPQAALHFAGLSLTPLLLISCNVLPASGLHITKKSTL